MTLAVCAASAIAGQGPSQLTSTIELGANPPAKIDIGTHMGYAVDPNRQRKLEEIIAGPTMWNKIERSSANFGYTENAYWFHFRIHNGSSDEIARFLELPRPFLDDVRLFHLVRGELLRNYALGDEQAFAQRVIQHQHFVMPLSLVPGDNDIYLRLASTGTIEAPLILWEPAAFYSASADEHLLSGIVFGVLLIMIAYNLFVYVSTRDLNYVYYIGFVASYLLFWSALSGYGFAYVWPQQVRWNSMAVALFISTACVCAGMFTLSYLKLKQSPGVAYHYMRVLTGVSLVLVACNFVLPYGFNIRAGSAWILVMSVSALLLGYWRWWNGAQFARYFCLAWTSVFAGIGVLVMSKFGLFASNFWVENASQIGIITLVVMLSLTLADRINTDRALRLKAQAVALEQAKKARASQRAMIKATEDANQALEARVRERTNELNIAMQQLQYANEKLQQLSNTDGLTQIANRAYFDLILKTEHKRASRLLQPLAMILFDIDHFKAINDTYGHPAGDAVLRYLADFMRPKVQRAGDLLARFGGEEFVVLLINSTLGDAMEMAEEFRASIERLEVPIEGGTLKFTASFGVASAIPDMAGTPDDLFADADKALYQAKSDGRNCVRAALPNLMSS